MVKKTAKRVLSEKRKREKRSRQIVDSPAYKTKFASTVEQKQLMVLLGLLQSVEDMLEILDEFKGREEAASEEGEDNA